MVVRMQSGRRGVVNKQSSNSNKISSESSSDNNDRE